VFLGLSAAVHKTAHFICDKIAGNRPRKSVNSNC